MFVDRFMSTAVFYPCNYGYIRALARRWRPGDAGDNAGAVDYRRGSALPSGGYVANDRRSGDEKALAVPVDKLISIYRHQRTRRLAGTHARPHFALF
jgi:inorganic pyrophosphatase